MLLPYAVVVTMLAGMMTKHPIPEEPEKDPAAAGGPESDGLTPHVQFSDLPSRFVNLPLSEISGGGTGQEADLDHPGLLPPCPPPVSPPTSPFPSYSSHAPYFFRPHTPTILLNASSSMPHPPPPHPHHACHTATPCPLFWPSRYHLRIMPQR